MCNAGTAILGTQIAGGINQTVGSYYAAGAQKRALRAQAFMDELNAAQAMRDSNTAITQGERAEQIKRLDTAGVKGKQRAGFGANGIALDSGTPQRVFNSTDVLGEIDALTIQQNAVRASMGYRSQATDYQNKALMSRATADSISPFMSGLTTLLGSASSIATSYYGMKKVGMFSGSGKFDYSAVGSGPALASLADVPVGVGLPSSSFRIGG